MNRLDGIRATGKQELSTIAKNGATINITLHFRPAAQKWVIDIECKEFFLTGTRVCSSLNLLEQYKNIIPFGLAVITDSKGEPFLITDFSSGRVNMYILTPDEIKEVENFYVSKKDAG